MAVSDADGQATLDGVEVSDRAVRAIGDAIEALLPYRAEDARIAGLISKLGAIASPTDFSADDDGGEADRDETVAKAMMNLERISKSEGASPGLREGAAAVRLNLERSYLAKHSGGAAVWERSAREAGRVTD